MHAHCGIFTSSCACACLLPPWQVKAVKENETDEERMIRLQMEALAADEKERRAQVRMLLLLTAAAS